MAGSGPLAVTAQRRLPTRSGQSTLTETWTYITVQSARAEAVLRPQTGALYDDLRIGGADKGKYPAPVSYSQSQEIEVNPVLVACVYAVVGVIIVPLVFAFFRTQYQFVDVVLASVAAAAASCIPTIGGPVSLVVMVAVLYWRMGQNIFPDIVVAVGAARLAMVPVLLAFSTPH